MIPIRTVRVEEFDAFMRYIERTFGHSKDFFKRVYPHIYQPTEETCAWANIVEEEGEIVSHVGLYPIEVMTAGVRVRIGGIGAVSTATYARGKGYMSALLSHVVDEMRRLDYPLSWLGGDRQRYNTWGWEVAGQIYTLTFSQRSLNWKHVATVPVEEVLPDEALSTVQRLGNLPACYAMRPRLAQQIHKMDARFWIANDGYVIALGQGRHHVRIIELVSASGNELGLLKAVLDWNHGERLTWELSPWDTERIGQMMPYTSWWDSASNACYRLNDLTAVLMAAKSFLETRAVAVRNFALAVGVREHDRLTVTTITVEDGEVGITTGRHAEAYVEIPVVQAARLFLGGPPIADLAHIPSELRTLLPIPVYIPQLDHV